MTLEHPKVKRLLEALRHGDFIDDACAYAGISEDTFYRWAREGRELQKKIDRAETLTEEEEGVRKLSEAIKEAELVGQHAALAVIQRAANSGTWQAAAWFLERRNKKWSNRTEVTGPNGGPVEVTSREELTERMLELLDDLEIGQKGDDSD